MTRLASAFGEKYQSHRQEMLTRSFELGGHTFKVKIPLIIDSDRIYNLITSPPEERINEIYAQLTEPLIRFKEQASEEFQFTDTDIIVSGRSMREAAKSKVIVETRIVEYIKLLVPENPENSMDGLTYAYVESEWPLPVQLALVEKIGEVISPTYKESRKN